MRQITLIIIGLLVLAGCGSDKGSNQANQTGTDAANQAVDTLAMHKLLYRNAADSLVGHFSKALKGELLEALNEGEAVGAISVCKEIAPAIAESHSVGGWTIKRVSDRFRNPDNRVDTIQQHRMSDFHDTSSTAPTFLVDWQKHEADDGMTFTYYQPIRIQPLCLKCHGDLQTLGPGVYDTLRKYYPLDRATGYRTGDLRGMFVVTADYPTDMETAELLVSGQFQPMVEDSVAEEAKQPSDSPQ